MLMELGPSLPQVTGQLAQIPSGSAGVRETLKIMAKLARDGKKTVPVRLAALQITQHLKQKDRIGEIRALHAFVRDRIRYVRDILGVETLQDPIRTLQLKAGDCDDKSTLIGALLLSIGHPVRFHAVGFRRGSYSHVYAETKIGDRWIPLETTEAVKAGAAPRAASHMLIHV